MLQTFLNGNAFSIQHLGEGNSKKANMSDYEIRRPSHVNDIANIVNKLIFLHAKVNAFQKWKLIIGLDWIMIFDK